MKHFTNVSAQSISWVKSNKNNLGKNLNIDNLYYPETIDELKRLIIHLINSQSNFDVIGYSSNTLFLPSYKISNMICTKFLRNWEETGNKIICDCGVPVSSLSKEMVKRGYKGFEGLIDLPGTIAAGIYGNCGCRECSVCELVESFLVLDEEGKEQTYTIEDLNLRYRSTSMKRGELKGVIIKVILRKDQGDVAELTSKAEYNHKIRKEQQPSGLNNLGTTFLGNKFTVKGKLINYTQRVVSFFLRTQDSRKTFPIVLKLIGKGKFVPYVYYWNRYMFIDETSHDLFSDYYHFLKTMYSNLQLEIEIKK